jgi:small subunit ribosomal protein S1
MIETDQDMTQEASEENFAEMLEQSLKESGRLAPGQAVEAKVIKVTNDWIFLDLGRKGEGILDTKEVLTPEGELTLKEGDTIRAWFVNSSNNELKFTTRVTGGAAGSAMLEDAFRNGISVEGYVAREIKGGFEVKVGNMRAFCPFSQMGLARNEKGADVVGKTLSFKINEYGDRGRNVVLSRRKILEEEKVARREALKETLREGEVVSGKITSVRDFGAFVDVGGAEGLIPLSELGWGRPEDLKASLVPGQDVEVYVARLDWETGRFTFSLKRLLADPWSSVGDLFPAGSVHHGRVARLANFGAFVTLASGIDGLLHVSRLGQGRRIQHPKEVLAEGDEVEVKVESLDLPKRRLSLSLVGVEGAAQPAEEEDFRKYISDAPVTGSLGEALRAARLGSREGNE